MRLEQMLGMPVGTYLGGTAAFFPYAPSPIPIEILLTKQQSEFGASESNGCAGPPVLRPWAAGRARRPANARAAGRARPRPDPPLPSCYAITRN